MNLEQLLTLAHHIEEKDLDEDTWMDFCKPSRDPQNLAFQFESHDWITRIFLFLTRGDCKKERNSQTIEILQESLVEALGLGRPSPEMNSQFTHLAKLKDRGSALTVRRFQIIMHALCPNLDKVGDTEIGKQALKKYKLLSIGEEIPTTSLLVESSLFEYMRRYGRDLRGFHFEAIPLKGMALTGCNLQEVDFSGLDLRGVDFSGAELRKANFRGAQLQGAKFIGAKLDGTDFRGVDLHGVDFSGAELQNPQFADANLDTVKFIGAKLTDIDFSGYNLFGVNFSGAQLLKVDFSGGTLWGTVKFIGAHLREVNFASTHFCFPDFQGATLTDLVFKIGNDERIDFTQVQIEASNQITFSQATIAEMLKNSRTRDLTFNYFNNGSSPFFSLLNSITSPEVRLGILEQIAGEIEIQGRRHHLSIIQELYAPFLDTLTKDPIYTDSQRDDNLKCRKLLEQVFLHFLQDPQSDFFAKLSPQQLTVLLPWIEEKIQTDNTFLEKYNTGIQLFLGQCLLLENEPEVCQKAHVLKRDILNSDLFAHLCRQYQDISAAKEEDCLSSLFFLSEDRNSAVVIEKGYARYYIYSDPTAEPISPTFFWSYQKREGNYQAELPKNPREVLSPWPLLNSRIASKLSQGKIKEVLALIFSQDLAMHAHFKEALSSASLGDDKKLTTPEHQKQLQNIFDPFYLPSEEQERTLTPEHKAQLFEKLKLQEAPPEMRSLSLLSLAAFFIKSSSSKIFGTETDSPTALRVYGSALLDLAREENNGSIPHLSENQLIDWKNRLHGREGAFTCTSVLFNMVSSFLKSLPGDERRVLELLPSVWH